MARLTHPKYSRKLYRRKVKAAVRMAKLKSFVKKKILQDKQYLHYRYATSASFSNCTAVNICQPTAWSRLFGTEADDESANQVLHKKMFIDLRIKAQSEPDNVDYTVYLLRAKKPVTYFINQSNGSVDFSGASNGQLWSASPTNYGQVDINPHFFKVIKSKRFTTEQRAISTNVDGNYLDPNTESNYVFRMVVKPRVQITGGLQSWKTALFNYNVTGNYFIVIFSNNSSTLEGAPAYYLNVTHTVLSD